MSLVINAFIFAVTAVLTLRLFYQEGRWAVSNGTPAFRYFTVLSNEFCAVAALLMCLAPTQSWVWLLKYVATVAVSVTMLTVLLFLGPNYGYKELLKGSDFFMHLLTPLLALVSFCVFEKRGLSYRTAMIGVLPVLLYGVVYLYKVVIAPEGKRWDDFYGFNKGGKWPIAFTAMILGALFVCLGLTALQNL